MQKTNTALSIKMTKDEIAMIEKKAKECGETKSRYARRVLTESVMNPLYTGEDVKIGRASCRERVSSPV